MNLAIEMKQLQAKFKLTPNEIEKIEENRKWAKKLCDGFGPMTIRGNKPVLVCGDWHIPFFDRKLEIEMFKVAKEYDIKTILIPGDFWDCDNYKNSEKFVNLTYIETFQDEKICVGKELDVLVEHFPHIYFCRGNHEKRWLKFNRGMVGIDELFAITKRTGYKVTLDDYMVLYQNKSKWYISHPDNYSPVPLSVASKIADKFQCNTMVAHGHLMSQGYDRTGQFQIVDGGGMFDTDQIEYMRRTTTFPSTHSGFYVIMDGIAYPFPGKGVSRP